MNIRLCKMTKALAREYFSGFVMDPALFAENQPFQPYGYSPEKADHTVDRHQNMGRVYMAVMAEDKPIGEVILKKIDPQAKHCTLGICLQSDDVKNRGYGTEAERLALEYAFKKLRLETVFADSLIKNTRSQHVLRKVGFRETHRDHQFVYYRCDRDDWSPNMNVSAAAIPV